MLIKNAHILTLNEDNEEAHSMHIQHGKIKQLWKEAVPPVELSAYEQVIDFEGKTIIPGFIDTHNHILSHGIMLEMVDCSAGKNKTIKDILERIKEKIASLNEGEWVQGYGYDDTMLEEQRHPTRQELDTVSPNHPVYVNHLSGHIAVANSKALEIANVSEEVEDTSKGQFGRTEDGQLNGVLYEHGAMEQVNRFIPDDTEEEMIEQLRRAAEEYIAEGITTNTVAAVGMMHDTKKEVKVHIQAGKEKINPMRTRLLIVHNELEKGGVFESETADSLDNQIRTSSNNRVALDGAKLFQDGSIQGLTAALREPYYTHPEKVGELIHNQARFNERLLALHDRGFRIAIHGNGDRAIGSILEAYEYVLNKSPKEHHLHRVEHAQTATEADLNKMQSLDVAASFFINHIYYFGDRHKKLFLGPERARKMNPLHSAHEKGILFTLHSDCPITPISPLFSVWAAVNRQTLSGEILGEEECCDVVTALKSMTIFGAQLNGEEEEAGSLEIGKRADFVVLDRNPLSINPMDIRHIEVLETYIDGDIVFKK